MLTRRAVLASPLALAAQSPRQPNIIVILADDYGFGSLTAYHDSKLKTPNLDRLAREGRRFTNAYAPGSVCSPTRYALMTGRYYWRTSVKDGEVLRFDAPLHIETTRATLASVVKSKGYRTAAFGKWHLGMGTAAKADWNQPLKPGPLDIGFDYFFGMAANPWSGPHSFIENREVLGKVAGKPVEIESGPGGATTGVKDNWRETEITQTLTARASKWIEDNHRRGPFMVYFAHTAVHRPVAPNPAFKGSPHGVYGDFVNELDASVGKLLDTLDRLKAADNTIVVFTSDNGGVVNRNVPETAAALDSGLAVNGALRGGKHDIWEGGFRVPYLVRWPGKVPAGTVSADILCHTDVLATLAGIVGASLAPGNGEDSIDAIAAWTGKGKPARDHVIVQDASATYAFRQSDWKLVERENPPKFEHRNRKGKAGKKGAPARDELFHLATDPAEKSDVLAANPEVAARLRRELSSIRERGFTRR